MVSRKGLSAMLVIALSSGRVSSAQNVVTPSSHFGAPMYPENEPIGEVGLHFDRFTQFGKERNPGGTFVKRPYNGITQTIGLNLIALSSTGRIRGLKTLLYRLTVQAGYSHDQPTRFLQNNVVHALRGLDPVPVDSVRKGWDGGAALDVNYWSQPGKLNWPLFLGAGGAFSTISNEAFIQGGARAPRWGPSFILRAGLLHGGDAFPSKAVAKHYLAGQASGRVPTDEWFSFAWGLVPELEFGYTSSSGLFADTTGHAIPERFWFIRATWSPLTFETWNDSAGNKDQGPTYGVRLYLRSQAFSITDWIR